MKIEIKDYKFTTISDLENRLIDEFIKIEPEEKREFYVYWQKEDMVNFHKTLEVRVASWKNTAIKDIDVGLEGSFRGPNGVTVTFIEIDKEGYTKISAANLKQLFE